MPPAPAQPDRHPGHPAWGQLTTTTEWEFPGFRDVIQAVADGGDACPAEHVGTKTVWDHATRSTFAAPVRCSKGDSGEYHADSLVIATGAQAKWLNMPSEERRRQGAQRLRDLRRFFSRGKKVAVIAAATRRSKKRSTSPTTAITSTDPPRDAFAPRDPPGPLVRQRKDQGNLGQRVAEFVAGGDPEALSGSTLRTARTRDQPPRC